MLLSAQGDQQQYQASPLPTQGRLMGFLLLRDEGSIQVPSVEPQESQEGSQCGLRSKPGAALSQMPLY